MIVIDVFRVQALIEGMFGNERSSRGRAVAESEQISESGNKSQFGSRGPGFGVWVSAFRLSGKGFESLGFRGLGV
jgi:hypothetical protein